MRDAPASSDERREAPLPPDDHQDDEDAAEHREDEIADYLREHREI